MAFKIKSEPLVPELACDLKGDPEAVVVPLRGPEISEIRGRKEFKKLPKAQQTPAKQECGVDNLGSHAPLTCPLESFDAG